MCSLSAHGHPLTHVHTSTHTHTHTHTHTQHTGTHTHTQHTGTHTHTHTHTTRTTHNTHTVLRAWTLGRGALTYPSSTSTRNCWTLIESLLMCNRSSLQQNEYIDSSHIGKKFVLCCLRLLCGTWKVRWKPTPENEMITTFEHTTELMLAVHVVVLLVTFYRVSGNLHKVFPVSTVDRAAWWSKGPSQKFAEARPAKRTKLFMKPLPTLETNESSHLRLELSDQFVIKRPFEALSEIFANPHPPKDILLVSLGFCKLMQWPLKWIIIERPRISDRAMCLRSSGISSGLLAHSLCF